MKTKRRAAQCGAALVLLLLATAMSPTPVQTQETDLTRARLVQFAKAHIAFNSARDEFHGKVGRVHDEDGRRRAREELDSQVAQLLAEHKVTREEYDQITLAISRDENVRTMFDEILVKLMEEGTSGDVR